MKDINEIRDFFAKDRFATENGAFIEEVAENFARISLDITDHHRNALGAVMGGVYFLLADFAFAVAANHDTPGVVSLDSTISFAGAAKGNKLYATAECVKNGRSTVFYKITVEDEIGTLCALINTTGFRISK